MIQRMDIKKAFHIFDLDAKSSPAVIKRRYYDLAAVWHPDLHANSSRLQKLASEKMKEINLAYEIIRLYLENQVIIACNYCGADNIKRVDLNNDYATCSTCGKQLKKPLPRKKRVPCGNYRCAGTIGSNGRCNYCGKTLEEGRISTPLSANNQNVTNIKGFIFKSSSLNLRLGRMILIGFAAFIFILSILYAYNEILWKKNDPILTKPLSTIDRGSERILTSNPIVRNTLISRTASPSIIKDDSYYRAIFKNHEVKKEDAIKLQQILKTLGYKIEKSDGVISKKTILCLKQYCIDFGYIPGENFPDCFFKNSFFHNQIALEHKDWLDIYLTHDLENWVQAQSDDYRKQIYELALDSPNTVIQLVRRYKFEKYKPLPKILPETGIIKKNFAAANGHLKIRTKPESNNYYIKLFNLQNNQEILSAFIRSGSTLSAQVPFGVFELKYTAGHNWYGLDFLFGTSASYAKLPNPITFTEKDIAIGGLTIELIPHQYGKLNTEIISEYDF
jgi:hypothetical protein